MNSNFQPIVIQKTPASIWDEQIDWTCAFRGLGSDTIASSAWAVEGPDSALTLTDPSIGAPAVNTTIWLNGGTVGNYYTVTNTIVTTGGRTLTETFVVFMVPFIFLTPSNCI